MASAAPGTAEYSYYESMANQYSNLAEWIKNASDEVKEKYKNGGGQVVDGFDVIDSISGVEVQENSSGESSQPVKDIIIKSVKVYTAD